MHVAGFSGLGFSRHASSCSDVSFATRAPVPYAMGTWWSSRAASTTTTSPSADIRAGFERLMTQLRGHRVVVVGPPSAPSRAHAVPRVDGLLADLSEEYGAAYVRTSGWSLPYLDDRLHLTPAGHRTFGDNVAEEIASLAG